MAGDVQVLAAPERGREEVSEANALVARTPDLEVIVPALNEQDRIHDTLVALIKELRELPVTAHVRVIDNGSSDRTPDRVDRLSHTQHGVVVTVEGCSRRGKGAAVARGMVTSSARVVGFCDADLATPAEAIADALRYLNEGWPIVIGSRRVAGAAYLEDQPLVRRLGGVGFRALSKKLTGDIRDTQCGFKFFRGDLAREFFTGLELGGFAFDVEVLARARSRQLPVKEMPVEWTDRSGSTFHPVVHGIETSRDLWRLRRASRRVAPAPLTGP
jgi:dolichyl-phosphate beta-glucosyltransferase